MTVEARSWLPDAALTRPELLGELEAAVTQWSERWFGARGIAVNLQTAQFVETGTALGPDTRRLARSAWLNCSPSFTAELGSRGVDPGARSPHVTEADRTLLVALGERMLADLSAVLVRWLGEPAATREDAAPRRCLVAHLVPVGRGSALAKLSIADSALASICRGSMPLLPHTNTDAVPFLAAAGQIKAEFTAELGTARISALELGGLAEGDVVLIDQVEAGEVLLRHRGSAHLLGRAQLVNGEQGLQLRAT